MQSTVTTVCLPHKNSYMCSKSTVVTVLCC